MSHRLYLGLAFLPVGLLFVPWRLVIHYRLIRGKGDLALQATWLGMNLVEVLLGILNFVGHLARNFLWAWAKIPHQRVVDLDLLVQEVDWQRLLAVLRPTYRYILAFGAPFLRGIEELNWQLRLGTADAAVTAIIVGGLQTVAAWLDSALLEGLHLNRTRLTWAVIPAFDGTPGLDLALDCILRVNVGYIMIAGGFSLLRSGIGKGVGPVGHRC